MTADDRQGQSGFYRDADTGQPLGPDGEILCAQCEAGEGNMRVTWEHLDELWCECFFSSDAVEPERLRTEGAA